MRRLTPVTAVVLFGYSCTRPASRAAVCHAWSPHRPGLCSHAGLHPAQGSVYHSRRWLPLPPRPVWPQACFLPLRLAASPSLRPCGSSTTRLLAWPHSGFRTELFRKGRGGEGGQGKEEEGLVRPLSPTALPRSRCEAQPASPQPFSSSSVANFYTY